jgi:hypothetical protein
MVNCVRCVGWIKTASVATGMQRCCLKFARIDRFDFGLAESDWSATRLELVLELWYVAFR